MASASLSGVLKKRDYIILLLIGIALYLSSETAHYDFEFRPAFYARRGDNSHDNSVYVSPLVEDLDGDGKRELITVTNDFHLTIYNAERDRIGEGVYPPRVVSSVFLTQCVRYEKKSLPVAVHTGYAQPYSPDSPRTQIILVLLDDWTLLAFNNQLQLLWEKEVGKFAHNITSMRNYFVMDEVAIDIIPLNPSQLYSGAKDIEEETGVILIGGNMKLRSGIEHGGHVEEGMNMRENGEVEHPYLNYREGFSHFSVFALSASSGVVLWKHDGTEVLAEQYSKSLPQHTLFTDSSSFSSLSLTQKRLFLMQKQHGSPIQELAMSTQHSGEHNWIVFRDSFLYELPHFWEKSSDSHLHIAHFDRSFVGKGSQPQVKKNENSASNRKLEANKPLSKSNSRKSKRSNWFNGVRMAEVEAKAGSHLLPHGVEEHILSPNVVVLHTKHGIEVLSLIGGDRVTALSLAENSLIDDLNGDGVVDTVFILDENSIASNKNGAFAFAHSDLEHCMMLVVSGLPPNTQLFNGSLCATSSSLNRPLQKRKSHAKLQRGVVPFTAAPPLALFRFNSMLSGVIDKVKNVIVAVNTGAISSYSGDGKYNWQSVGGPHWSTDYQHAAVLAFDFDYNSVLENNEGSHNSPNAYILVSGEREVTLNSPVDGAALTKTVLPKVPITRPILGDFDNDNITDFIVLTEDAIMGFHLEVTPHTPVAFVVVSILAVISILTFALNIRTEVILGPSVGSKQGAPVKVYSLRRSTDDSHQD